MANHSRRKCQTIAPRHANNIWNWVIPAYYEVISELARRDDTLLRLPLWN